ncbi:protein [Scardovia inopinata]|uniref:DUF2974 domain-containing protein n=1 Tax=Scardovia inopinata F0304 TaxID=641146 RepID=W5IIH2_SCAIO|nr:Mbeg1-like protein [Scardovia inopinata]EFG26653.1 hypothetical protein HMPREF9020_00278 [Scardovia inopinata F0304]BAR06250.1 conserved hypothetical protein [Scardovia inopinata JCM 12537]SUV51769.1 protein [Scardovia inopinata]
MADIISYAQTMFDTFDQRPFNRVDSLLFSYLAYVHYHGPLSTLDLPEFTGKASSAPAQDPSDSPAPDKANPGSFFRRIRQKLPWHKADPGQQKEQIPDDSENFLDLRQIMLAENFPAMFGDETEGNNYRRALEAICQSPRYRGIQIGYYLQNQTEAHNEEQQFGAVTFLLPDGTEYLSFRGTEASLVGWKEDFEMTYHKVIPSQNEALAYLTAVAGKSGRPLRLGGHSKGGNMAVYAAANASQAIQARILGVYSHDGPGFWPDFYQQPGWQAIKDKEDKTCPEFSLIGQLLYPEPDYSLVACSVSGINQHYCLNWLVEEGDFKPGSRIDSKAQAMADSIRTWTKGIPVDKRQSIVNHVYAALRASGYDNINELTGNFSQAWPKIRDAIKKTDPDERSMIYTAVKDLMGVLLPSMIGTLIPSFTGSGKTDSNKTQTA